MHVSRFLGPLALAAGSPSPQLREWIATVLGVPRYDVYYTGNAGNKFGPGAARLRVKDYNFDAWLSEPLIQVSELLDAPVSFDLLSVPSLALSLSRKRDGVYVLKRASVSKLSVSCLLLR